MNIALFDAAPYWSGGAERVYLCCKGFIEQKHKVILICFPTSRLNIVLKDKVKIYNIHPVTDLDFVSLIKIIFILLKEKVDILDVHSPKFYWIGFFTAKLLNKKFGITRNVIYRKQGIKKVINRILYNNCDFVISVSNSVKKLLIEDFNLPEGKVFTIYDGFELINVSDSEKEKIKSEVSKELNIGEGQVLLTTVARIERIKGHSLIIKSLKKIIDSGYDARLLLIGQIEDKKYFEEIKFLVENLQLTQKVIFAGFKQNIAPYIISSDIIISASYSESMGKSILESVRYKVPFVATDIGGLREVLQEDIGIFVPVGDLEKLCNGIISIIKNKQLYKNKIQSANLENLSYKKMSTECLNLYRSSLLEKR